MVFKNEEEKRKVIFKGTYTRGTNAAVYYGDVFEFSWAHDLSKMNVKNVEASIRHHADYMAGFYFEKEIEQQD